MNPASHCMLCDRPDNADDLVQCDKCDGYVHFACAEVGDSIADEDRSFTCQRCIERLEAITVSSQRSSKRTSTSTRSSLSAARLTLRLQQLETERQNRLKELEDAERFQRLRRQVEADFEKQKLEALESQLLDEEENRSTRSRVSARVIHANTHKWIGSTSQSDDVVGRPSNRTEEANEPQIFESTCNVEIQTGKPKIPATSTSRPALKNIGVPKQKTSVPVSLAGVGSVSDPNSRTRDMSTYEFHIDTSRGAGQSTSNQVRDSVSVSNVRLESIVA